MAKGEIVETSWPDNFTGPGGRNRVRGGAQDNGGQHDMGASGPHARANGDAMSGNYSADQIGGVGGVNLQNRPGESAVTGEQGKVIEGARLHTQREIAQDIGNAVRPGSLQQGPKGEFGDKPGDSSKQSPYVSGN